MSDPHLLSRGYIFDLESNRPPVAVVQPAELEAVVGSVVRLDGRSSWDPQPNTTLSYSWAFAQVPIGSQVEVTGFTNLESDASVVSFAPDVVGHYKIRLVVNDGSLDSDPAYSELDVRLILVPNHKGLVPDASFIWNYLSDFWKKVEGRRKFEVFWSAAIQVVASELLRLYQYDYNKSIRDIQRLMQRRWLHYDPYLDLSETKLQFILAEDQAGLNASTALVDPQTGVVAANQPDYSNMVSVPAVEGSFQNAPYGQTIAAGRVLTVGGRTYTMARTGTILRSSSSGTDGSTVLRPGDPPAVFHGSGFTAAMVGSSIHVLAGALLGSYPVTGYQDSTTLLVAAPLPPASNLSYAVLPARGDSAFFSDRNNVVPTKQNHRPWRFSATLTAADLDFEEQGVSPGDLLQVKVTRTDTGREAVFAVQVVAVDRHNLGFVLPLTELEPGVAANGLDLSAQLTLADALKIPSIIQSVETGEVLYTQEAAALRTLLRSPKFKRTYYERPLTADDLIDLELFQIKLTPLRIIRNHLVPVADEVMSVPVLQEYIKQPEVFEKDGQLYQATDGDPYPLARRPKVLVENLDYVIDADSTITGVCTLRRGENLITIPYGDLVDRSVAPGDKLLVAAPKTIPFDILDVVDAETVRVQPTPTEDAEYGFTLVRRRSGRFIRFVSGSYTAQQPAPERLWAEISYLDNSDCIEGNFGVLVNLTAAQLKEQESAADYRSAVAGLMYSLVSGSTVGSLELAGQILLGLPFAEQAGVITEIDQIYRRNTDGSPRSGRILIEGRDAKNQPTGLTNIYLYPLGSQVETAPDVWEPTNPSMSGLAINPETGVEYKVGDAVSQFARLSKGVEVQIYQTSSSWYQQLVEQGVISAAIQKYHAFRFQANADLASSEDMDLTAQFLRELKSSQTRIFASFLQVVQDRLEFEDELMFAFGRPPVFFDTPAFSLPMPAKFDSDMAGDIFVSADGKLYCAYLRGADLISAQATAYVTSPLGGFVNARPAYGEAHDSPFIRGGDVLEITEGPNAGRYPIAGLGSGSGDEDTTAELELGLMVLTTAVEQPFVIYRVLDNPLFSVQISVTNGETHITLPSGGFSAGITVGDVLVFRAVDSSWVSRPYRIKEFDPGTHEITLLEALQEASGTYSGIIVREALLKRYFLSEESHYAHLADFTADDSWVSLVGASSDVLQLGLLRPHDLLETVTGEHYEVIDFDRQTLQVYVLPAPPESHANVPVRLVRPSRAATLISTDILDRFPEEHLDLCLVPATGDLLTTSGSAVVSTVSGVVFNDASVGPWIEDEWVPPHPGWPKPGHIAGTGLYLEPGDVVEIMSGLDAGRHVVGRVGTTSLTLTRPLQDTVGAPGIAYKLWRVRPDVER